jgi:hypothetical protein
MECSFVCVLKRQLKLFNRFYYKHLYTNKKKQYTCKNNKISKKPEYAKSADTTCTSVSNNHPGCHPEYDDSKQMIKKILHDSAENFTFKSTESYKVIFFKGETSHHFEILIYQEIAIIFHITLLAGILKA